MKSYLLKIDNEEGMFKFAKIVSAYVGTGDTLVLEGQLGVGKTTFIKYVVASMGSLDVVKSPTYTIMRQYNAQIPIYHFDFYRIQDESEDLGWEDYFDGRGICFIEWGQKCALQLPKERLEIFFSYVDENKRDLYVTPIGSHYVGLWNKCYSEVNSSDDYRN